MLYHACNRNPGLFCVRVNLIVLIRTVYTIKLRLTHITTLDIDPVRTELIIDGRIVFYSKIMRIYNSDISIFQDEQ